MFFIKIWDFQYNNKKLNFNNKEIASRQYTTFTVMIFAKKENRIFVHMPTFQYVAKYIKI